MNVSDVIIRVQRLFGDQSGVQIDDNDIIRYINDAQREIVMHNEAVLETTTTVNIVAGQNIYAFPTDLLVLRSLRVQLTSSAGYQYIKYYNLSEFDKVIYSWDGGDFKDKNVLIYTLYGREIFLYPTPNVSITDGLKLLYSTYPTDVALTTDELSVPLEYHNAVLRFCLHRATMQDEDYQASAIHEQQFLQNVQILSNREGRGARETYPTITTLPDDL